MLHTIFKTIAMIIATPFILIFAVATVLGLHPTLRNNK